MRKFNAVLFDMDGVLIDAKFWHYQALNWALADFELCISSEDHVSIYDGLPTRRKLEILSDKFSLTKEIQEKIHSQKQIYTIELARKNCKPNIEHLKLVRILKDLGYKIAVCSNSIRSTVEIFLDKAELLPYMDLILSNEDVKKCKPDPEIYSTAMNFFGLPPQECLILEDNENGITSGRLAGGHVEIIRDVKEVNWLFLSKILGEKNFY